MRISPRKMQGRVGLGRGMQLALSVVFISSAVTWAKPAGAESPSYQVAVVSTTGSATVGPSGGRIELNGASVAFPTDAVKSDVSVTLALMMSAQMPMAFPRTLSFVGGAYALSTGASQFEQPVEISLPYDTSRVRSGEEGALGIYIWNGRDYISLPTDVIASESLLKARLTELRQDSNLQQVTAPAGSVVTMGLYVLKEDLAMVSSGCYANFGAFNGAYCECPWGTGWDQWAAGCGHAQFQTLSVGTSYKVLTANVGNFFGTYDCSDYNYKLCYASVEGRIRDSLSTRNPDIVTLQETFPNEKCATVTNPQDPTRICSITNPYSNQYDRLLPPTVYQSWCTSVANPDHGRYECTGIKRAILGTYVIPTPADESPYDSAVCLADGYIPLDTGGFARSIGLLSGNWVTIINGHTAAPNKLDDCKSDQIHAMFQLATARGLHSLIMGDMNMDPNSSNGLFCPGNPWDASASEWNSWIVPNGPYVEHDDINDLTTSYVLCNYSFDHVVSDFSAGQGVVCQALYDADNLDQGSGMDHNAVWCPTLQFPPTPDTTITNGPPAASNSTTASFSFSSTIPNSTFICQLDSGSWSPCAATQQFSGLGEGSHSLQVISQDSWSDFDTTPAAFSWVVDVTPPDTQIQFGPAPITALNSATFVVVSTELNSSLQCSLDGAGYTACPAGITFNNLTLGSHTLLVRAADAAGNMDQTPASYSWTIAIGSAGAAKGPGSPPQITTAHRGDLAKPMLQIQLSAGPAEDLHATQVKLKASGSGNDNTSISAVKIWLDSNGNGQSDASDSLLGSGTFQSDNGTATIIVDRTIQKGTNESWLVTYDVSTTVAFVVPEGKRGGAGAWLFLALMSCILFGVSSFVGRRYGRVFSLAVLLGFMLCLVQCGGGGGGAPASFTFTTSVQAPGDIALAGTESGSVVQTIGQFPIVGTTLTVSG